MKIRQGVTTEIVGNCGSSAAPLVGNNIAYLEPYVNETLEALGHYASFGQYLEKAQEVGLINNQAILVGHKPIRTAVMGMEARPASADELEEMKRLLATALDEGAVGLSSGLLYPPMCFATVGELVELCRVVAARGGVFACHMRNYSSEIIESMREIMEIAEHSGVAAQISHFMLAGKGNWGKAGELLGMIDEAREKGIDIALDQYPYRAANPDVAALLPPWMHEGGLERMLERLRDPEQRERAAKDIQEGVPGWENISSEAGWENLILLSEQLPGFSGESLQEIAQSQGQEPTAAVFEILLEDPHARTIAHWVSEEDVRSIMQHPCQTVSSDSGRPGPLAHPRTYGTFPRVLGEYIRNEGVLRWEEAIRKMTSFAPRRFGLDKRGLILEGWHADLVVFDPDTVAEKSTFEHPDQYPVGIEYVVVNGELVVEEGEYNGSVVGRILRRH
jgi:N-acyl-D-amino-acid deacylase